MFRKTLLSFSLAWQNIRANWLHTLLSVLGIVIGVAALVAMLSLIDGIEQETHRRIRETSSVNAIMIQSETMHTVNHVRVRKDSLAVLDYAALQALRRDLPRLQRVSALSRQTASLTLPGKPARTVPTVVMALYETTPDKDTLLFGRTLTETDQTTVLNAAVINQTLAKILSAPDSTADPVGKTITLHQRTYTVVGVVKNGRAISPVLKIPLGTLDSSHLRTEPPIIALEAPSTPEVPALQQQIKDWLQQHYPGRAGDFNVVTNQFRVDQISEGFVLFRVVMGMIIGLSILVGGIGVMNVLLISVTERTQEIGIRKAMGAKKGDIVRLFLAESMVTAGFGALVGLLVGMGLAALSVPILKMITKQSIPIAYTAQTLMVIGLVALAIGLLFGTYPALKAARLDPVEAMRRE